VGLSVGRETGVKDNGFPTRCVGTTKRLFFDNERSYTILLEIFLDYKATAPPVALLVRRRNNAAADQSFPGASPVKETTYTWQNETADLG